MEIERQFLIEKFPELPEIYAAQVWQGYLSTAPVVRIRRFSPPDGCDRYELTVKGKGTMVRAEVNISTRIIMSMSFRAVFVSSAARWIQGLTTDSCTRRWNLIRWRRQTPLSRRHFWAER